MLSLVGQVSSVRLVLDMKPAPQPAGERTRLPEIFMGPQQLVCFLTFQAALGMTNFAHRHLRNKCVVVSFLLNWQFKCRLVDVGICKRKLLHVDQWLFFQCWKS